MAAEDVASHGGDGAAQRPEQLNGRYRRPSHHPAFATKRRECVGLRRGPAKNFVPRRPAAHTDAEPPTFAGALGRVVRCWKKCSPRPALTHRWRLAVLPIEAQLCAGQGDDRDLPKFMLRRLSGEGPQRSPRICTASPSLDRARATVGAAHTACEEPGDNAQRFPQRPQHRLECRRKDSCDLRNVFAIIMRFPPQSKQNRHSKRNTRTFRRQQECSNNVVNSVSSASAHSSAARMRRPEHALSVLSGIGPSPGVAGVNTIFGEGWLWTPECVAAVAVCENSTDRCNRSAWNSSGPKTNRHGDGYSLLAWATLG